MFQLLGLLPIYESGFLCLSFEGGLNYLMSSTNANAIAKFFFAFAVVFLRPVGQCEG